MVVVVSEIVGRAVVVVVVRGVAGVVVGLRGMDARLGVWMRGAGAAGGVGTLGGTSSVRRPLQQGCRDWIEGAMLAAWCVAERSLHMVIGGLSSL